MTNDSYRQMILKRTKAAALAYLTLENELPDRDLRNDKDWMALSGLRSGYHACVAQLVEADGTASDHTLFSSSHGIQARQILQDVQLGKNFNRQPSDMHIRDKEATIDTIKAAPSKQRAVIGITVLKELMDGTHHSQSPQTTADTGKTTFAGAVNSGSRRRDDPQLIEAVAGAQTAAREVVAHETAHLPDDIPSTQNTRNTLLDIALGKVRIPRSLG